MDAIKAVTGSQKNVGEMLDEAHKAEKKLNGRMLMNVIQNIQFLGRQGIALQGHEENESNFIQLLKLRSHDQPVSSACSINYHEHRNYSGYQRLVGKKAW